MHRIVSRVIAGAIGAVCSASAIAATAPADPVPLEALYAVPKAPWVKPVGPERAVTAGGALRFRWNQDLLRDFGIGAASPLGQPSARTERGIDFQLSPDSHFEVAGTAKVAHGFASGEAMLQGGFAFETIALQWQTPRLTVRAGEEVRIDFLSSDGEVWFYADRLMYEFIDDGGSFRLRTADLRVSAALALLIGRPDAADQAVAELRMVAPVALRATAAEPKACDNPNWTGKAVPNTTGGTYAADVFMQTFSGSFQGCQGCDGPGGASDGGMKFVPSSTLKNNINNASLIPPVSGATIPGDPLGTSTVKYAADVPWYEKFTTSPWPFPYLGNDQHPYLIWNLYRVDSDGRISQIGRSGVKHAFLTTNGGCAEGSCSSHILGRSCSDTYGISNNDASSDLGPRSEIIPATGVFGRCGSIFDPNCDGIENGGAASPFDQRMIVMESAIDPAVNPGASYLFESWYLAHLDVDIYNTMATRPVSFAWSGSTWPMNNNPSGSGGFKLGAAIDRWADVAAAPTMRKVTEINAPEGHTKVAIRVTDLTGGLWRYDYAVMNFDFSRAVTTGREDNHTLRVLSNNGFNRFTVPRSGAATISQVEFADGDSNAGNNWSSDVQGGQVVWQAPAAASSLNWGSLFRFSYVANTPPADVLATLDVTEPGTPTSLEAATLGTGAPLNVSAPASASVLEDATQSLAVTVFDSETAASALVLTATSSNEALIPSSSLVVGGSNNNRTVQITPLADQSGSALVTLTVTDGDSNQAVDVVDVTVQPVNDAPSLTLATVPQHSVGDAGAVSRPGFVTGVSFGGGETQAVVAYQVTETSDPSGIVSSAAIAANGTLTYTLSGAPGTAQLSARVQDSGGTANGGVDLSVPVNFTIIVVDQLSIAVQDSTVTVDEDQSAGAYTVSINDPETAASALVVTASSNNPALLTQSGIVLGGSGAARTLQMQPVANASGTAVVTLTVTDGDNNQVSTSMTLNVRPVNDAPSFTVSTLPQHDSDAPGLRTVPGFVTSVDMGGGETQNVLEYVVAETSDPANVVSGVAIANNGTLTYTLSGNPGDAVISARLRDSGGTANGGVDLSQPVNVGIVVGDHLRVAAVTTLQVSEDTQIGTGVAVSDPQTPAEQLVLTAVSSDQTVIPNSGISLGGSGAARTLDITPVLNGWGVVDVTLTVTDGDNNQATQVVRVTVWPVNDAPTLTLGTVAPRTAGSSGTVSTPGFVTSFALGSNETQSVAEYIVNEISDPNGVVSGALLQPNGTLVHQLSGNRGTAHLSARVRDNGGTANGGADTSAAVEFRIVVDPSVLLQDGFESP